MGRNTRKEVLEQERREEENYDENKGENNGRLKKKGDHSQNRVDSLSVVEIPCY